jgi:hypothetical protein
LTEKCAKYCIKTWTSIRVNFNLFSSWYHNKKMVLPAIFGHSECPLYFLNVSVFSDKGHFHLPGYLTSKTWDIGHIKTHANYMKGYCTVKKVTVWCWISTFDVIRPFFMTIMAMQHLNNTFTCLDIHA